jgi:hypothetical protein
MCASGMMIVCYLVPCTSERMNVGSWRARGGARGLLWTSLSYRGMCPRLRGRLPLRPVPVTPPVHALAGANEAESGALVSARLPHSMQHVESGENLVKILIAREVAGRRRSASRLYALHPDRRRRRGSRADGLASRASGHDASMRDENDKRRDDRCFVFDRVTSQARRYFV